MTTARRAAMEQMATECIATRARMLGRTITSIYDAELRGLGVTTAQVNVLGMVAIHGPIAPGEVAKRLRMEKSTVSRNQKLLVSAGWLRVSPGESARQKVLELTPAGRRLLERAFPCWERAQERTEALLGAGGVKAIHRAARAVLES